VQAWAGIVDLFGVPAGGLGLDGLLLFAAID
jgi:hypothetical protein